MSRHRKGLRGIGAFLASSAAQNEGSLYQPTGTEDERLYGLLRELQLEQLQPGRFQPRQNFAEDTLAALADSIRSQGIVQPLVVRPLGDDQYEILAGERRWRAAQRAALTTVPCMVRELDDQQALFVGLVENLQREDLNPMEEASALRQLQTEFGLTQAQLAEQLGKRQPEISRMLGLLELDAAVQELLREGRLTPTHARILQTLPLAEQARLGRLTALHGWSVQELERQRTASQTQPISTPVVPRTPDPDLLRLQERLSQHFGSPVQLRFDNRRGRGRIEIPFYSLEECDGLLEKLGLSEE